MFGRLNNRKSIKELNKRIDDIEIQNSISDIKKICKGHGLFLTYNKQDSVFVDNTSIELEIKTKDSGLIVYSLYWHGEEYQECFDLVYAFLKGYEMRGCIQEPKKK